MRAVKKLLKHSSESNSAQSRRGVHYQLGFQLGFHYVPYIYQGIKLYHLLTHTGAYLGPNELQKMWLTGTR